MRPFERPRMNPSSPADGTSSQSGASPSGARAGVRLGTSMRKALADAYDARGHGRSGLWPVYSPKADRDFVLRSDLEFGHFLLVESDPEIVSVDYAPAPRIQSYAGEGIATIVDAEVTLRSGAVIWREVKCSEDVVHGATGRANLQLLIQIKAAEGVSARHELVTEKEIYANPQRILNWMRILPWIAQARDWPLHEYASRAMSLLKAQKRATLGEVLDLGSGDERALYGAGLFKAMQRGCLDSDLDERPLSIRSVFRLHGGERGQG